MCVCACVSPLALLRYAPYPQPPSGTFGGGQSSPEDRSPPGCYPLASLRASQVLLLRLVNFAEGLAAQTRRSVFARHSLASGGSWTIILGCFRSCLGFVCFTFRLHVPWRLDLSFGSLALFTAAQLWLVKRLPVLQEEFHQFTQAGKSAFKGDSQTVARIDLAAASPCSMLMAPFRRVDTPADAANAAAAQPSAKSQRCIMKAPPCCLIIQRSCPRRRHPGSFEGLSAVSHVF